MLGDIVLEQAGRRDSKTTAEPASLDDAFSADSSRTASESLH